MAYENLLCEDFGHVRIVRINRPKVHNALNWQTLQELERVMLDINSNVAIRAAIITGAGDKSFVAGADISEMKNLKPSEAEKFSSFGHRVMDLIGSLRVPAIAAVNGYAFGGGLELALACDFMYASESASFGLVETKLGLIPGFGGLMRLSRRVGSAYAKEMIYSGAQINASEALRVGLVNRVDVDVLGAAKTVAQSISERGPYAVSLAKKMLADVEYASTTSMNALESAGFGMVFSSRDHHEGIEAFLEKRKPNFEGN